MSKLSELNRALALYRDKLKEAEQIKEQIEKDYKPWVHDTAKLDKAFQLIDSTGLVVSFSEDEVEN